MPTRLLARSLAETTRALSTSAVAAVKILSISPVSGPSRSEAIKAPAGQLNCAYLNDCCRDSARNHDDLSGNVLGALWQTTNLD